MPNFGSIIKLLQYAPTVIGIVKQLRGGGGEEAETTQRIVDAVVSTRDELQDFKRQVTARMEDLERENARLKARVREVESSFTIQRVLLYTTGVIALLGIIMAMVALIRV